MRLHVYWPKHNITVWAEDNYLNHQHEIVSRYRDQQLQVGENYSYLLTLRQNICLNAHFSPNNSDLIRQKMTIVLCGDIRVEYYTNMLPT